MIILKVGISSISFDNMAQFKYMKTTTNSQSCTTKFRQHFLPSTRLLSNIQKIKIYKNYNFTFYFVWV